MTPRRREEQPEAPTRRKPITAVDIQQKEFRLAFRGYNERDVDVFLDELTEEVARLHAENKRLREQVDARRPFTSGTGSSEDADRIIRDAQEEAERILADARARASSIGDRPSLVGGEAGASDAAEAAALNRILSRERQFLQSLAALIQEHAEVVKQEARRAREAPATVDDAAVEGTPGGEEPATTADPPSPFEARGNLAQAGVWLNPDMPGAAAVGADTDAPEAAPRPPFEPVVAASGPEEEGAPKEEALTPAQADVTQMWQDPVATPQGEETAGEAANADDPFATMTFETSSARRHEERRTDGEDDSGEDRTLRELFWGDE